LQFKGEKTISLDMGAKTLQATDQELHDVFANINLVFLNGPTFERLFKADPSMVGSFKLPCDVVVTAGTAGIYASINGQTAHQEIIPTEVVDTTGAGDAVAAAILFGLRQNCPLQEVLWMGVKAASVKIQAFGGAAVLASQKDLLR
jgi:sugar/nucleoside kinase (ribokinase family)